MQVERSLDRVGDPLVAVAEDAAAEQCQIDDAVAGLVGVDHRCGQRGLVGSVEDEFGKLSPLVDWLSAIRDGQR